MNEYIGAAQLSHAAERLGETLMPEAITVLVGLLNHESPLVREGAVLGLGYFLHDEFPYSCLEIVAREDPSPGVRGAAEDALESYRESRP